jgi:translocation and assembly module TamB
VRSPQRQLARPSARVDPGRLLARALCLVFGLLGALPLGAGFIVRSEMAQRWVTRETTRLLGDLLGLKATYAASISLLPLEVELANVSVDSSDGGPPAIKAVRVRITPRVFSLIAGRLDIGDIEIERAEQRLVFEDGELLNVTFRLPEAGDGPEMTHAPFRSLSMTDTRFDITVDGTRVATGPIDLDVFTEGPRTLEIALRVGESRVEYADGLFATTRIDGEPGPELVWDEDVVCQLDARLRLDPDGILVRRLSLLGSADIDPDAGSVPACPASRDEPATSDRVDVRTSQLRIVTGADGGANSVEGTLQGRAPLQLLNRLTGGAPHFEGWATLAGDLRFDSAMRLPEFDGIIETGEFMLAGRRLAEHSNGKVRIADDVVIVDSMHVIYGGGPVDIEDVRIDPFAEGITLSARKVDGANVPFAAMMRDIDITPNTIVHWMVDRALVTDFKGTLVPPKLDGDVAIDTSEFEVFDRAYHDPNRKHMLGVKPRATLRGRFGVRDDAVQFNDMDIRFGKSQMRTTVHLGFDNTIRASVPESTLDLSELSPLVTVPVEGIAKLTAEVNGEMSNPLMKADLNIDNLVFAGFPIGNLSAKNTTFRPLWVEIADGKVTKGGSTFRIPHARLDFGTRASINADLQAVSKGASVRDFLAMWRFEDDPRWKDLEGALDSASRIRYVLGGPGDPCGEGNLDVTGSATMRDLVLFDEDYDSAEADYDFNWKDIQASYHGMNLNLSTFHLQKGTGSVIGNVQISPGANIRGNVVATAVPLSEFRATAEVSGTLSGTVSGIARLDGTLDELESEVRASVSPVMLGRSRLPGSQVNIHLKPTRTNSQFAAERTKCGNRVPVAFDFGEFSRDRSRGDFHVSGQLFGQQIMFDKFSITRQQRKIAKGGMIFNDLNLAPLMELRPEVGMAKQRPAGKLSGRVDLARMPLDDFRSTQAVAEIGTLWLSWRGFKVSTEPIEALTLSSGRLSSTRLSVRIATPAGHEAAFDVTGGIENIADEPTLNLDLVLRPVQLDSWAMLLPSSSQVAGVLEGQVQLRGPVARVRPSGGLKLRDGRIVLRSQGLTFNDVELEIALDPGALIVKRASAAVGGGTLQAEGRSPLQGFKLGEFRGHIQARSVTVPVTDGVQLAVDADLDASWQPSYDPAEPDRLPKLSGSVELRSFEYSRAVTMNAEIASIARRGKRTEFESYDPSKDIVELDVNVTSDRPLRLNNNLLDANLRIERPGLQLTGTNQRFGMRGRMRVESGGRIRLRRNEFEVESGEVRFDDATTITPRVDLRAVTEYRRYSTGTTGGALGSGGSGAETGSAAGQWRIAMHAHGDAENLKIDLTSQPKLSQDDIFLLLTVGLTRAELDQAQSQSLGESVALEALGSLTGADSAVTEAIPVIDEFRFGSSYSSRTGRTEPTVTVGKRLNERIRAFVTSGISESREVRSNLEWRLNPQVSVEGSYDNVNDISSSTLGNLGADVRWRLEFE